MFSKRTGHVLAPITRSSRRFRGPAVLLGASGVFLCLFSAKTIYLDNITTRVDVEHQNLNRNPFSALKRRKSTDSFDARRHVDIDRNLREYEESYVTDRSSGIARYDIVQMSSNDPNEDDHSSAIVPHRNGSWSFFAVLDGHSGWETSAWLRENMIPAVVGSLADLYGKHNMPSDSILSLAWNTFGGNGQGKDFDRYTPNGQIIDDAIKNTFKRLDDDIVHWAAERVFSTTSKKASINLLAPAWSGSCALLAFYDSHTRMLRTAVTGDSRAVLGRRTVGKNGEVNYEVHVLSVDQDGNNSLEIERLNNSPEHPGEEVIKDGRVLGMGPSRAFGDARWKWSGTTQRRLQKEYLGRSIPANVKTPPYLTAEPVITTTKVEKGDFLVMATDGLWECLQSEEAVGLVGAWLNQNASGKPSDGRKQEPIQRNDLPVTLPESDTTVRYRQWAAKKEFVNVDENTATHLTRNALGGADEDLAEALLSMRTPRSRTYRDDITVVVVFFDE